MGQVVRPFHGLQSHRPSPASSMISASSGGSTMMQQPGSFVEHQQPIPTLSHNQSDMPNIQDGDSASQAAPDPIPDPVNGVQEPNPHVQELFIEWSSKTNDTTYRYNVSARPRMAH